MLIFVAAAVAVVVFSGDVLGRTAPAPATEVVVGVQGDVDAVAARIEAQLPDARVRWRYRLVFHGVAVVLPANRVAALRAVDGVGVEWPNVTYRSSAVKLGPQQIGADKLWGANFETAGQGMKIGIIDDGVDASNPYFNPTGFAYPAGYPKGQTQYATPKVIVQRAFPPPSPTYRNASLPFDPAQSFHATHVAGIAAGDRDTPAAGQRISGVAPMAYIGNYKALTIPTPDFGLDGNAAEIAAAIEAAVSDGMNVINLSLGEPEVEPSRDLVVRAIEGAAAAGVVPVVAAGNDGEDFSAGSISSPGNAPSAITVAAVTAKNVVAGFSSAGPTPLSLQMKPDVAAPGVDILSSLPSSQGTFGLLSGTSMAAPHVSGSAALLKERHPTWTVAQIKSALEQTGDPATNASGPGEAPPTREGGGVVDLPRADNPLVFAAPTGVSFGRLLPGQSATRTVSLTDAGAGTGTWTVTTTGGPVTAPPAVSVPGTLELTATNGASATAASDAAGFVVLTRGGETRRIPFWYEDAAGRLAAKKPTALAKPGTYTSTTTGASLVSTYRYPATVSTFPGPERVFRAALTGAPANAGVVVLRGSAFPLITVGAAEDHLAGYTALPLDLNPYRASYGAERRVAGVVLPAAGTYDLVFDTRSQRAGGPFTFRYWVNDTKPPTLRVRSTRGAVAVAATDAGSGVDPLSIHATVDGKPAKTRYARGVVRISAPKGRHGFVLTVSDYQETKNMEDVAKILPNTTTLRGSVVVR